VPFRVFGVVARPKAFRPLIHTPADWRLVQSSSHAALSPALVRRFHFAVGARLDSVAFMQRDAMVRVNQPIAPSLRVSPPPEVVINKP
jgi:hypothetical protein